MKQEVEKLRAEGYPLIIIGNDGYHAILYGIQPLNDGEYMAIYRYPGGQCCHDLKEIKQCFKVVEW